jgi:hypothetical protein
MTRMKPFFALSALILLLGLRAPSAPAHDGPHGPEQKVAPHGGVLRDSSSLMLELVKSSDSIRLYPLTHAGKPIDPKLVEVLAAKTTLTDARGKPVTHEIKAEGEALTLKFTKGPSHRYSLTFFARFEGKENKARWQIETGAE